MSANIPQYLLAAEFAQLAYAEREANEAVLKGGFTTPRYSYILSVTRQAIQIRYDRNPTDPTLQATGEFMYALSGGANTTPNTVTTPFIIIIHPQSQTVTVGTSVTFTVTAAGGTTPYTYQWQKNGVNIGGATSQSLTINPTSLGSAGTYDCVVTDANGQVIQSNNANLVVNAVPLTADWWWSADTDPYPALSGGTDNLTYLGSVSVTHLAPIVIPWPSGSADNTYRVVRYDVGEGAKILCVNTILNQGPIPGTAYHEIVTIGSKLYIISKGDSIFSPYIVTYS